MTKEDVRAQRPRIKVLISEDKIVDAFIVSAKDERFVPLGFGSEILGEWSWSAILRSINNNRPLRV